MIWAGVLFVLIVIRSVNRYIVRLSVKSRHWMINNASNELRGALQSDL